MSSSNNYEYKRALQLHQDGKLAEAEAAYTEILKENPQHSDCLQLLGLIAYQKKQYQRAVDLISQAISIVPSSAVYYLNLGAPLKDMGRFSEALENYDRAVALNPESGNAWYNRGVVLQDLQRYDEAITNYQKALLYEPNHADAAHNCGIALEALKRPGEALSFYEKAVSANPGISDAWYNRGKIVKSLGRWQEALSSYENAIKANPANEKVYVNYAHTLLLTGNFSKGWEYYEWRWQLASSQSPPKLSEPKWDGKLPLSGKTILLTSEQGLGDTIQFCRYVSVLAERGARVILEANKVLLPLLESTPGISSVVAKGALPDCDLHCPLLSLPLLLKTTLNNIPQSRAYLTVDQKLQDDWRIRLGKKNQTLRRIGLAWAGNPAHAVDEQRSIALAQLLQALPKGQFEYVSLQKDVRNSDLAALQAHPEVRHFGDQLTNFADTAALCMNLDLVISVDTSIAHLSGALGKPVWILLPAVPDWRWLLDRRDSVWYATARLYRQHIDQPTWSPVLQEVANDLKLS